MYELEKELNERLLKIKTGSTIQKKELIKELWKKEITKVSSYVGILDISIKEKPMEDIIEYIYGV